MNAATNLKPAEPTMVMPEEVRSKLSEAKARLSALTGKQMQLAEKSVQDEACEREYGEVLIAMAAADADVQRLSLAISSMDRRATEQLKAAEAAEIRSLQGRVVDMLEQRLEAARVFEAAITEAVNAMRRLAALGKAAHEAWPGARQPAHGVVFGGSELSVLIAAEMARLGSVTIPTGGAVGPTEMALPPPRAPSLMTAGQPDMIEPLTVAIGNANTFGKTLLGAGG
jgi:hypothetical protein